MHSTSVKLVAAGAALAASTVSLSACGSHHSSYAYYDRICVSPHVGLRLPNAFCLVHAGDWYYIPAGFGYPIVGGHVSHYSASHYRRPTSARIYTKPLPTTSGKAPKHTSGAGVTTVKKPSTKSSKTGSTSSKHSSSNGGSTKKTGGSKIGKIKTKVKSHFGGGSKRH